MTPLQLGLPVVTASATALVGAFVAFQAYRGYRRNDSRPMLALAVGIALLTTVAFLVRQLVAVAGVADPAGGQLAALTVSVVGLLVLLYSFTGA